MGHIFYIHLQNSGYMSGGDDIKRSLCVKWLVKWHLIIFHWTIEPKHNFCGVIDNNWPVWKFNDAWNYFYEFWVSINDKLPKIHVVKNCQKYNIGILYM